MSTSEDRERPRRYGWWSLLTWALGGVGLELSHAFKWAPLLDDPLRREWLRWAHAHGVGLSLILLAYAAAGGPAQQGARTGTARLLLAATWLLPLGFALGAVWHYESDPGPGIALAPAGAACLLAGLWRAAREARGCP